MQRRIGAAELGHAAGQTEAVPVPYGLPPLSPAAKRRHLRLPSVAEREDQHLLINVRVAR